MNTKFERVESQTIVSPNYSRQVKLHAKLRQDAKKFEEKLEAQRNEWVFIPPSNITVRLPNAVVLSVPQEAGRVLLHKRLGHIIEHNVTVDAVLDGGFEDIVEELAAA